MEVKIKSSWVFSTILLFWELIFAEQTRDQSQDEGGLMELIKLEQQFIMNLKAYTEKLNEKVTNLQA